MMMIVMKMMMMKKSGVMLTLNILNKLDLIILRNTVQLLIEVTSRFTMASAAHVQTADGLTPLHIAILEGHLPVVEYLLAVGGTTHFLSLKTLEGLTCLHVAVIANQPTILQRLLDHFSTFESGPQPLLKAVDEKSVNWWTNVKDEFGETCLHLAVREDNVNIIKILALSGARLDVLSKAKETPVGLAIAVNHHHLLPLLLSLKHGATAARQNKATVTLVETTKVTSIVGVPISRHFIRRPSCKSFLTSTVKVGSRFKRITSLKKCSFSSRNIKVQVNTSTL